MDHISSLLVDTIMGLQDFFLSNRGSIQDHMLYLACFPRSLYLSLLDPPMLPRLNTQSQGQLFFLF